MVLFEAIFFRQLDKLFADKLLQSVQSTNSSVQFLIDSESLTEGVTKTALVSLSFFKTPRLTALSNLDCLKSLTCKFNLN